MTAILLANHVWQSTIVAGVAWLITVALRRNRASVRHGVWLVASLKFLVPFALLVNAGTCVEWRTTPVRAPEPMALMIDAIGEPFSPGSIRGNTVAAPASPADDRTSLIAPLALSGIWFTGFATVLLVWWVRWRGLNATVRRATPIAQGPVFEALRRLERSAGLGKPISLVSTLTSVEPGVFGITAPVLLWPQQIAACLGAAQIEAILAHEISHVRRRDNLAAAAHMVVQAVFWFHPLVWWMGSRLVDERERACDEDVLCLGSEPRVYAESILKTCQFCVESPLPCVAGVTGSDLRKRIEQIMRNDYGTTLTAWKRAALAAIVAAAVAAPIAAGMLSAPVRAQAPDLAGRERQARQEIEARLDELNQEHEKAVKMYQESRAQKAEASAPAPAFDVTSVKPNNSGDGRIGLLSTPGGGWQATNVTLGMLVRLSYQVQDDQIAGGPAWLFSNRFDVVGSGTAPGRDGSMFQKLQTLLSDRFGLVTHKEERELPIFTLVPSGRDGRIGPQIKPSTADCPVPPPPLGRGNPLPPGPLSPKQVQRCAIMIGPGRLTAGSLSMTQLAASLSRVVGRMVVDRTNLSGKFELALEYAPDPTMAGRSDFPPGPPALERPAVDGPSIFAAVQEQLGLKLESTKGLVDVLVIDRAEQPTEN